MSALHRNLIFLSLALAGKSVIKKLDFCRGFQRWDVESIQNYQKEQLNNLIRHFSASDLMAGSQFRSGEVSPDLTLQELLGMFPLMGKGEVNELYLKLLSRNDARDVFVEKHTSGSSGNPVVVLKDRHGLARELAATWRSYEWAGVNVGDRGLRVWGRKVSPYRNIKNYIVDTALNRFRVNAFAFNDLELKRRLSIVKRKRPRYIYGYVSVIRELARVARESQIKLDRLVAVITTAEPLDDNSRKIIEDGFSVKCFDEYGCSEVGSIAHECEHGALHIMADNLIVETITDSGRSVVGEVGEIVVTDLSNYLMPMVRYRVGDYAILCRDACPCGRSLPILKSINGRVEDILLTPDGLSHHPASVCYIVDDLHKQFRCIQQYQVVQQSIDRFALFVVPKKEGGIDQPSLAQEFQLLLRERLHGALFGEVIICESINREPSGKYRLVKRGF